MKVGWRAFSALLFLLGCGGAEPPPQTKTSVLPEGSAARVGSELIGVVTVTRVAERQDIVLQAAVGLAVSDALLAQGARSRLAPGAIRSIERAAAARALLEQLSRDAGRTGASDAELATIVRERWVELDRRDAVRTTHAVVMNDKPEQDAAAHALADKLAAELRDVTSGEELIRLAQALPAGDLKIRAEPLPFVTADGRTFQKRDAGFVAQPGGFDPDFARAANALEHSGQLSPVVKSSFGYHVIRLEERLPGVVVPKADLPRLLGPEVLARRASRARRELLDKLHQASQVLLERAADDLTAQVKVAP
jgi:hypothetical protein